MRALACLDAGAGPTVVLVHGFLFDHTMWRPQLPVLVGHGFRVISVDLLGFGGSARPVPSCVLPLAAQSAAMAELLDELGVRRAVFVGYSMGGQVVMDFLRRSPERVEGLVFADTFAEVDAPDVRLARLQLADRLEREGVARYADEFLPRLLDAKTIEERPEVARRALAMMRSAGGPGAAAALRGRARRRDYRGTVASATVPALVVAGERDVFDRGVLAAELAATMPCAALNLIPGAGHTPSMERPARFNAVLLEFLARR